MGHQLLSLIENEKKSYGSASLNMDNVKQAYTHVGWFLNLFPRQTHHVVSLIACPMLLRGLHTSSSACIAYKKAAYQLAYTNQQTSQNLDEQKCGKECPESEDLV